jgi:transposase
VFAVNTACSAATVAFAPHNRARHINPKMWSSTSWDRSGFWILYKRLEQGTFAWPSEERSGPVEMRSGDLALLVAGVDVTHTRRRRWYERVTYAP